jgi:hypothetical protein
VIDQCHGFPVGPSVSYEGIRVGESPRYRGDIARRLLVGVTLRTELITSNKVKTAKGVIMPTIRMVPMRRALLL